MHAADLREHLLREGISRRVVDVLMSVPRDRFVPPGMAYRAWEDHAMAIGHGQTISQPTVVALMTEAAAVGPGDHVLDVGTGSGYQAAVLAACGARVHSIERLAALADRARATEGEAPISRTAPHGQAPVNPGPCHSRAGRWRARRDPAHERGARADPSRAGAASASQVCCSWCRRAYVPPRASSSACSFSTRRTC